MEPKEELNIKVLKKRFLNWKMYVVVYLLLIICIEGSPVNLTLNSHFIILLAFIILLVLLERKRIKKAWFKTAFVILISAFLIITAVVLLIIIRNKYDALQKENCDCSSIDSNKKNYEYIYKACLYVKENKITSTGNFCEMEVKSVEPFKQDTLDFLEISFDCCYAGDVMIYDVQNRTVTDYSLGPM
ncbi:hypothetical protein H8S95_01720 [Pontibacter sp. KCTC 32443]|uniref:hypothetical protein n=1 Tax=Pontibacter TaxID=323449 RepID=UPI00164D6CF7|nr:MULTISPECIES: hypothetical protein [Pontibacter]MBC5772767.1 hypothetical protein [Pontibacter sp. KCTC 32443]